MLNSRAMERTREYLDTFLAGVRPGPSHRAEYDISYRLTEDAFVLFLHQRASESALLTPHACFKAVHSEDPSGWLLYAPDDDGHWLPNPEMVFVTDVADALAIAEALMPDQEPPRPLDMVG